MGRLLRSHSINIAPGDLRAVGEMRQEKPLDEPLDDDGDDDVVTTGWGEDFI